MQAASKLWQILWDADHLDMQNPCGKMLPSGNTVWLIIRALGVLSIMHTQLHVTMAV